MLPSSLIFHILTILLSITSPTVSTTANDRHHIRSQPKDVGINCEGSSQCSFTTNNSPNILAEFNSTLYLGTGTSPSADPSLPGGPIPDLELFFPGDHIICARNAHWLKGSICIFLQGRNVPESG
ncbi:MAG: hypothetical protein Q9200_005348, partial [Gallowayella weberi]